MSFSRNIQPGVHRPVFRFRRWSRKGYAAFASLHRAVTMGRLAAHVAERFQAKQNALHKENEESSEREEASNEGRAEATGSPLLFNPAAGFPPLPSSLVRSAVLLASASVISEEEVAAFFFRGFSSLPHGAGNVCTGIFPPFFVLKSNP